MDPKQFQQICLDASKRLALKDTGALGAGFPACVDGVDVEIFNRESNPGGLLVVFEVGNPDPVSRLDAYESVLALQTLWMSEINGMFAYDAASDRLLFVLNAPALEGSTGEQLADLLKGFAAMVEDWRQTILKGRVGGKWAADAVTHAALPSSKVAHV